MRNGAASLWANAVAAAEYLDDNDDEENGRKMKHSEIDQVSLEMARQVADRLRRDPELLNVARANLARWSRQNASAGPLLRCYAEWNDILSRPVSEICDILCSDADEAQRLRQNSPFVGILSPAEVWEIKKSFRHAPAAA
jgi:hypothetical protein